MAYKYPLKLAGMDITNDIIAREYSVRLIPVYTETITTMDGVEHVALLRNKHAVTFQFNPISAERIKQVFSHIMDGPFEVEFFDLITQETRYGTFRMDAITASYLYGVMHEGKRWNLLGKITLKEL